MKNKAIIYIVIPCYNEEEVLHETSKRLLDKFNFLIDNNTISTKSKIVFVNDGSSDKTWDIITQLNSQNKLFCGINLSCNKGHQNALLAGLMTVKEYADAVISMDADLQDDINAIDDFIKAFYRGNEIVYGVRSTRKTDTFFKKNSALLFYKLMNLLGAKIVYNHADYRLMSKRALNELENFKEVNLFLRGIVPLLGFDYTCVEYKRNERFAGESKYPLKKMLAFAIEGITSFSIKPIRLITSIGILVFSISLAMMIYFFIIHLLDKTVPGWSTIVVSIWGIGGIQLLSLGVIGEYVAKTYLETKARPKFIIKDFLKD